MSVPVSSRQVFHDAGETVPSEVLDARRVERLTQVVEYAHRNLSFYRRTFEAAGYEPGARMSMAGFARDVPTVSKSDLVAETRARVSAEIGIEALDDGTISNIVMTSGTHGFNTFGVLTEGALTGADRLGQERELWMMGIRPGTRVLTMSPAWHALALVECAALTGIGALPITPWGTYSPQFTANVLDAISQHRPEHVLATRPVLDGLLEACLTAGSDPLEAFGSVQFVGCAGQALSPAYREHLILAMGLDDLFERGGSGDGMFGGGECEAHRGHHIFADLHYVEIVDPETGALLPDGTRGIAVVTNLTMGRSLYVRFDTDDVAEIVPGPCPCGRTHPVVEFYGRRDDCVVFPDRIIAPIDVRRTIDDSAPLRDRKIALSHLEQGTGVHVQVLDGHGLPERLFANVAARLRLDLGLEVIVSAALPARSGWKGQTIRTEEDRS